MTRVESHTLLVITASALAESSVPTTGQVADDRP